MNRLSLRLLLIALVPSLGLAVFASSEIVNRRNAAAAATDVGAQVASLTDVLELRFQIVGEAIPSLALSIGPNYGLDLRQLQDLLELDLSAAVGEARANVDVALAGYGEDPQMAETRGHLRALRTQFDDMETSAQPLTSAALYQSYVAIIDELDATFEQAVAEALTQLSEGTGTSKTRDAVRQLEMVHRAMESAYWEFPELVAAAAPEIDLGVENPRATLALDTATFRSTADYFFDDLTPKAAAVWAEITSDPDTAAFDDFVDATLEGTSSSLLADPVVAKQVVAAGLERIDGQFALLVAAGDDAHDATAALAVEASRRADEAVRLMAAVLLASLVVVVVIGRSIARPLTRMARSAEAVSAGDLRSVRRSRRGGPTEVRMVAAAFDDVVENLRAIESHAQALASGRLDDPILTQPLPGELGESLQASVERLSQSISEREHLHRRLTHEATHDSLTGLPNRAAVLDALERSVSRNRRTSSVLAVLFVDLDGFKRANDTFGHETGDAVLVEVARRLRISARGGDVVARLGGDEFLLVADAVQDVHAAVEIGRRIVDAMAAPMEVDGNLIRIGASVGVSLALDGHVTTEELVGEADMAVYEAKQNGRGRVEVFDAGMRREVAYRTGIESKLTQAIADGRLDVHFQPVLNRAADCIDGLEALVRWTEPDGTRIFPDTFIPIAEASALIIELDNYVLRRAMQEVNSWGPAGLDVNLAVNISARHLLDRRIVEDVFGALREFEFDPERLVLEITETMLLGDLPVACSHLEQLRAGGVMIALDDFGSGYTSLATLRQLPVDILKIDRSLVNDLGSSGGGGLVRIIIEAGHEFGLAVVAEGIETVEQSTVLQTLGCDLMQGYLFGRPVPGDEMRVAIEQEHAAACSDRRPPAAPSVTPPVQ